MSLGFYIIGKFNGVFCVRFQWYILYIYLSRSEDSKKNFTLKLLFRFFFICIELGLHKLMFSFHFIFFFFNWIRNFQRISYIYTVTMCKCNQSIRKWIVLNRVYSTQDSIYHVFLLSLCYYRINRFLLILVVLFVHTLSCIKHFNRVYH